MTTTTVTAKDTSSAMDDIMEKLGDDAVILSTIKKNGKVQMTATTDITSETPRRLKPSQQFSSIFENKMLDKQIYGEHEKPFDLTDDFKFTSGASIEQVSAIRKDLSDIKSMLNGVVLTEPENLNSNIGSSTSLRLRQAGFSSKVVKKFQESFLSKDYENGRVSFLRELAKDLVPSSLNNIKTSKIIYIVGFSGSGRTTLSAKLAAFFAGNNSQNPSNVTLAQYGSSKSISNDSLKSYGRLLNLKTDFINIEQELPMIGESNKMIIDVDEYPENIIENVSASRKLYGNNKVSVIIALPGGSNKKMVKTLWDSSEQLRPSFALTKLDECELSPIEFSEFSELNANISVITGTNKILDTIAISSENVLTQYLKENC